MFHSQFPGGAIAAAALDDELWVLPPPKQTETRTVDSSAAHTRV
jgi:hypothetical protein